MVIYNERTCYIEELQERGYFIKLKSHEPFYTGPPIPKSKLLETIKERGWGPEDVVVEDATLLFKKLYEDFN